MTNLQMMEELRPLFEDHARTLTHLNNKAFPRIVLLLIDIRDRIDFLNGRLNTTDHCIQQLQKRNADLADHISTLDRKVDDALCDLKEAEDDIDVRG